MLPPTIPIFPLPNVVLFPNVFLPLHIFETRYRQMVDAALSGDRIIGMVLLRPGWEGDYEGRPPVYPIGCAGVITHAERLPDGRFNIVLRGMEKFRIASEDTGQLYRVANVVPVPEPPAESVRQEMRGERQRLESLLVPQPEGQPRPSTSAGRPERVEGREHKVPSSMADEDLVNALAQYLEFDPVEKQALLERDGLLDRCRSLIELLEMKVLAARHSWDRDGSH
jgi:Lon protease-like protein